MDGLTSLLAGVALGEAGPRRRFGGAATALIAAAALAPDADLLIGLIDRDALVFDRRAVTHSVFALPLIAAALAGLWRSWLPSTTFLPRFALALTGGILHLILDLLDATGFKPWAPLSGALWRWAWMPPYDPWLWALLGAGLVTGWVIPRWGISAARTAIVISTMYVFLCGGYHALANAHLKESLTRLGVRASGMESYAQPLSPLRWISIGRAGDRYYLAHIHALKGLDGRVQVFMRQELPDKLKGPFTARYERWAHAPLVRPLADEHGGGLAICDLRFMGRVEGLPYVARIGEDAGGTTRHAWLTRRLTPPVADEEYELPKH